MTDDLQQRAEQLSLARADDTCGGWDESEQREATSLIRDLLARLVQAEQREAVAV